MYVSLVYSSICVLSIILPRVEAETLIECFQHPLADRIRMFLQGLGLAPLVFPLAIWTFIMRSPSIPLSYIFA